MREAGSVRIEHDGLGGYVHDQLVAHSVEQRPHGRNRVAHDVGKRDRRLAQLEPTAADARHVEQIVDEAYELRRLPRHRRGDAFRNGRIEAFAFEDLDACADRRERIAQLVRQQRDELVLAAIGIAELPLRLLAAGDVDERNGDAVGGLQLRVVRHHAQQVRLAAFGVDLPFDGCKMLEDTLRVGDEIVVAQRVTQIGERPTLIAGEHLEDLERRRREPYDLERAVEKQRGEPRRLEQQRQITRQATELVQAGLALLMEREQLFVDGLYFPCRVLDVVEHGLELLVRPVLENGPQSPAGRIELGLENRGQDQRRALVRSVIRAVVPLGFLEHHELRVGGSLLVNGIDMNDDAPCAVCRVRHDGLRGPRLAALRDDLEPGANRAAQRFGDELDEIVRDFAAR